MALIGTIAVHITANTVPLETGIARANVSLLSLVKTTRAAAGALGTLVGAFAPFLGIAALGGAIKGSEDFERALRKGTVVFQTSEENIRRLGETARRVASQTEFSSKQVAEGFFFLANAGLSVEQANKAIALTAKFAQAGQLDLARATDKLTDIQKIFGLESKDAGENLAQLTRIADTLVKGASVTTVTVEQLADALTNKGGLAASKLSSSLEEAVSVLLAFASQGEKGKRSGERLSIALRRIGELSQKQGEELKRLGVRIFNSAGELRTFAEISEDLTRILGNLPAEELFKRFAELEISAKAQDAFRLIIDQEKAIREFETALGDSAGSVDKFSDRLTPFQKGLNQVVFAFEAIRDKTIKPLLDDLGPAIGKIGKEIQFFAETWDVQWERIQLRVALFVEEFKIGAKSIAQVFQAIYNIARETLTQTLKLWAKAGELLIKGPSLAEAILGIGEESRGGLVEFFSNEAINVGRVIQDNLGALSFTANVVANADDSQIVSLTDKLRVLDERLQQKRQAFFRPAPEEIIEIDPLADKFARLAKDAATITVDAFKNAFNAFFKAPPPKNTFLDKLFQFGLNQYQDGVSAALEVTRLKFDPVEPVGPVSALLEGTSEAFSAIQAFRRGVDAETQLSISKDQLQAQLRTTEAIEALRREGVPIKGLGVIRL